MIALSLNRDRKKYRLLFAFHSHSFIDFFFVFFPKDSGKWINQMPRKVNVSELSQQMRINLGRSAPARASYRSSAELKPVLKVYSFFYLFFYELLY